MKPNNDARAPRLLNANGRPSLSDAMVSVGTESTCSQGRECRPPGVDLGTESYVDKCRSEYRQFVDLL